MRFGFTTKGGLFESFESSHFMEVCKFLPCYLINTIYIVECTLLLQVG